MVLDRDVTKARSEFDVDESISAGGMELLLKPPGPWCQLAILIASNGPHGGMIFEHSGGVRETVIGDWFQLAGSVIDDLGHNFKGIHGVLWHDEGRSRWAPLDPSRDWEEVERVLIMRGVMSL